MGTARRTRLWLLVSLVALWGCSQSGRTSPPKGEDVTATRSALTTTNGLNQNGLSTNGLIENGFWTNGFWTNGFWTNGFWTNGFWTNGFWTNGFWTNGFWTNGLNQNGFWTNGFWTNGFWTNGLDGTPNAAGQVLISNPYARELLQYIYSCAMPADGFDVTLDPNKASPISCSPSDGGSDGGTGCDLGYACSSDGKCVIPLHGGGANGSGLAINANQSTWWDSGKCDESCQRWISACVLARTNAYGVHVQISMRAPADAPPAVIAALAVTDVERNGADAGTTAGGDAGVAPFSLREGAYFGNIFATTPGSLDSNGKFVPTTTPQPDGTTAAVVMNTPVFYACAGPGSNIPEITKRFCSSQGDQVVINVPGVCLPNGHEDGTCDSSDTDDKSPTFGAIQDCYLTPSNVKRGPCGPTDTPDCYKEVLTVFLKEPISVCGDGVCDPPAETTDTCPSDCHPGSWARNLQDTPASSVGRFGPTQLVASAIGPGDSIAVAMNAAAGDDVDLGDKFLAAGLGVGVVARYLPDGTLAWSTRVGSALALSPVGGQGTVSGDLQELDSLAVQKSNGDITAIGLALDANGAQHVWGVTLAAADGSQVNSWDLPVGPNGTERLSLGGGAAIDSVGNVVFSGSYGLTLTLGGTTLAGVDPGVYANPFFLAKVTPAGAPVWLRSMAISFDSPITLALDAADHIVIMIYAGAPQAGGGNILLRMCADGSLGACADTSSPSFDTGSLGCADNSIPKCSDGVSPWEKEGGYAISMFQGPTAIMASTVDPQGSVYIAGWLTDGADVGNGSITPIAGDDQGVPYVVKYDSDGNYQWVSYAQTNCDPGMPNGCHGSVSQRASLGFDPSGNVLMATVGDPVVGGTLDFGVGAFPLAGSNNFFVSAYRPENGRPQWAKQVTIILDSNLGSFLVDGSGRVVIGGGFSGSMELADHLLVTEQPDSPSVMDSFLGSFGAPPSSDTTPSQLGQASAPGQPSFDTLPRDLYVEATSSAGAVVYYVEPTAIDTGYAGTTVLCTPKPNTTFPIGVTTVTCTATDPRGNTCTVADPSCTAQATFKVQVVDTVGPVIFSTTDTARAQAVKSTGAPVVYPLPTAVDQIDGPVAVTCDPPSGSTFAVGTTNITCTAVDAAHNQSHKTIVATVDPPPYGGSCASTADCGAGSCVDGVCCNTTGSSCGQCQACNVPGSVGACAPTSGGTCSDGNACTTNDTCQAGLCVGGAARSCDDQNSCTVDSCDPTRGCVNTPGNAGVVCRAAASACDSAEACTGASAVCPASTDKRAPVLAAGTNQTIVGSCTSAPVSFALPTLANASCETATTITCKSTVAACSARDAKTNTLPSNSYGAHTVTCTARDAAGNVSAPVSFTVTVLQPLTVKIQPPLSGDNDAIDNVVKVGSIVSTKVLLYACGANVTKKVAVIAKLGVSYQQSGGAKFTSSVAPCNGPADTNGVMLFDGADYRYNLATKGFSVTQGVPAFYQENITVAYQSAPSVIVGTDSIEIDTK